MSVLDPERLHRAGPSLVRDALEAERGDPGPAPERLRLIEAALEGTPAAATAPGRGAWGALGGVTLVGLVALVGLGIGLPVTKPAPAPSVAQAPVAVAPPPPATPVIAKAPEAAKAVESEAPKVAQPPVASPDAKAAARPSVAASEADEMALVARAQDALHGRPAEALALCREHERTFAKGHFVQEREAIAIEALVSQKRTAEAERRWKAFERAYPSSSHRTHLAALFAPSVHAEPGSATP